MSTSAKPERLEPRRIGLIARKIGMTRVFDANGDHVPVTVLQFDHCQVVQQRRVESDGYVAVQIGAGKAKPKNVAKPQRGHFAKAEVEPKAKLTEFRVSGIDALVDVGQTLATDHFVVGQLVDVRARTIGKGFTGAMKRWGFAGLRASHGVSVAHRSHGSTGNRQDPGRVFKNKKMAGHKGDQNRTQQNLLVVRIDDARGVMMVKGSVPGCKNAWVKVSDAIKHPVPDAAPRPAQVRNRPQLRYPDDLDRHMGQMRNAWADFVDHRFPHRLDAAMRFYLSAHDFIVKLSNGRELTDPGHRQSIQGVRRAAAHILTDTGTDLPRIGALLLALAQKGPSRPLAVRPYDPWPAETEAFVRNAVEDFLVETKVRLIVRHDLHHRRDGALHILSGSIDFYDRLPELELGGPFRTDAPAWLRPDAPVALDVSLTSEGAPLTFRCEVAPGNVGEYRRSVGVRSAITVKLTTSDDIDNTMLRLRPSIAGNLLDPIYVDVDHL